MKPFQSLYRATSLILLWSQSNLVRSKVVLTPGKNNTNTFTTRIPGAPINTNTACSTGDPHILTFDGLKYDCHGEGEYVLLQSNATAREIQARFEHVAGNVAFSVAKGFAIKDEGDTPLVQISVPFLNETTGTQMGDGCKLQMFVDGEERDLKDGSGQNDKVLVTHKENDVWVKYVESQFSVKVRYFQCYVSICVNLPNTDSTRGVLGTANGSVDDDWTILTGEIRMVPRTLVGRLQKPAYDQCQEFCIRNQADSLFVYPEADDGLDFDYYEKCDLPYGNTIEDYLENAPEHVIEVCRGDLQCIIDVINTGDAGADELREGLEEYGANCNPPGGECDTSECCEGECVDFGGYAGKICSNDSAKCTPEYGNCTTLDCCEGHICKTYDNGSSLCVLNQDCKPQWTSCLSDSDCCDGLTCLDNHRGSKSCRRLPFCAAHWDDCSHVSCCGDLKCTDTEEGGRQCLGIPDCWITENRDCSVAPCCIGLTCVEHNGRSLCKRLPESAGPGENCLWVPCTEGRDLQCTDTVDSEGTADKLCLYKPSSIEMFIFNDLNSNGIQEANEPGIPGIRVQLVVVNTTADEKFNQASAYDPALVLSTNEKGIVAFPTAWRHSVMRIKVIDPPPGAIRTLHNKGFDDAHDSDLGKEGSDPFKITSETKWTRTDLGYRMPVDVTIKVFDDANSNGIQDEGEPGIMGVRLHLVTSDGERLHNSGGNGTAHLELETDEDGFVTFIKVPQGTKYRAMVTKAPPGAVPTASRQGGDSTLDSDLRSDGSSYEFMIHSSGAAYNSLDLGYRMPETVTVRVWNDVNTNGIQDVGETGIQGVKLRLVHEENKKSLPNYRNHGTAHLELVTDVDGLVHFEKVPQKIKISVKVVTPPSNAKPTFKNKGNDTNLDSNLKNSGYSDPFYLEASGTNFSQISLGYRVPGSFIVRVWDDEDGNGIQDDGERGIKGVVLQVINALTRVPVSDQRTTNSFGFATFGTLPENVEVQVQVVNAPRAAHRTSQNVGDDEGKDSDLGSNNLSDIFKLSGTKTVTEIDLGYRMPQRVIVRVWDDKNGNGIQDLEEVGIEGVSLRLVKDKDRSLYMGECDGASIIQKPFADTQVCKVCNVDTHQTIHVACTSVPLYLQRGGYEGNCIEPNDKGNCEICHNGKTIEVKCKEVAKNFEVHLGAIKGPCEDETRRLEMVDKFEVMKKTVSLGCSESPEYAAEDCHLELLRECKFDFVTNATGFAIFNNVPKGIHFRVMVTNEPEGAIRTLIGAGGEDEDSDLGGDGLTSSFNLAEFVGSSFESIDIGYLMPDDVEVRVFDDANANGLQDENEIGISGVQLQLIHADNGAPLKRQRKGTAHQILTTDETGHVLFTRVPVSVHLRVKVLNAPKFSLPTTSKAGSNDELDSDLLDDGTSVPFNLRSFTGSTYGKVDIGYIMPRDTEVRVWNDKNRNGLQDHDERGIRGVRLRLMDAKTGQWLMPTGGGSNAHEELSTDSDGFATFRHTPKGRDLVVKVTTPPHGGQVTVKNAGGDAEKDSNLGESLASDPFNLNSFVGLGAFGSIDLGFFVPSKMIVRVWEDRNNDGLQDLDEPGIMGVELRLVKKTDLKALMDAGDGGNAHERIMSDAEGNAVFTGVPQGVRLRVEVTAPPESAQATLKNIGNDDHLDSDLSATGLSDSFQIPSDTMDLFDSVDLGYVYMDCVCSDP